MIEKRPFGRLTSGQEVSLFTLTNNQGMRAGIIDFGAAVVSLLAPDKHGTLADVVLGYDALEGYVHDKAYFGVIVGRCANRTARGRFVLDGREYHLTINDGQNHLHGGVHGFHKVVWRTEPLQTSSGRSLKLTYRSPDGQDGYPGNLIMEVIYTLNDGGELVIEYTGSTDKPTILNPTHHSYFNLSGTFTDTILDHHLMIDADYFTPIDKDLIATGELRATAGTPLDFHSLKRIGERIEDPYEQLGLGRGYDHNYALRDAGGKLRRAAEVFEPESGRVLTVSTDQPGLQLYSGNFLDGTAKGKHGVAYQHRSGLCLEAQHFPDSPNKPQFPSVVLRPGEVYRQTTTYGFSARR